MIREVVSETAVLGVLSRASIPLPTLTIAEYLADRAEVDFDAVPITRLRRTLERLAESGALVAGGGPKREQREGWPVGDGRDVRWATKELAESIERAVREEEERTSSERTERGQLLRDLHSNLTASQRSALGIIGVWGKLRDDPDVREESGALSWSLDELRVVGELAEQARG